MSSVSLEMEEVPAEALPGWSSCTDAELVKAYLASSDRRVFAEIVRRHAGMVMAVCRRATLQESDAEDAFQATFLILARSARKIRRRASLASWLYGVAQRTAIRSRRMREPSFSSLDLAEPPAPQDLFSELANQHEAEQVDAVLAELPEVYREPLLLFHLEGLSVREIAERLASTAGSIEGRLKRGRLQLKRKLLKAGISLPAFLVSLQALHSEAIASEPVVEALLEPTLAMATGVEGASCSPIIDSLIQQELIPMVFKSPTLISLGGATTTVALLLAGTVTLMSGHSSVVADDGKDPTVGSTEVSLEEGAAESPNVRAPGSDKKKGKDPFFSVASGSDKGESSGFAGDGGEYPDGLSTPPGMEEEISPASPRATNVELPFEKEYQKKLEKAESIRKTLHEEIQLQFVETPLSDVVDIIGETAGVPIRINRQSLDNEGLHLDEPVTFSVDGVSLESALDMMLLPLKMDYIYEDETLQIVSHFEAEKTLVPEIYTLNGAFTQDAEELSEAIHSMVAPDTWVESGGKGDIFVYQDKLLILQTQRVHREIAEFLAKLKRAGSAKGNANPAMSGGGFF